MIEHETNTKSNHKNFTLKTEKPKHFKQITYNSVTKQSKRWFSGGKIQSIWTEK